MGVYVCMYVLLPPCIKSGFIVIILHKFYLVYKTKLFFLIYVS